MVYVLLNIQHEQLSAGTAGRGRDVDGLGATRAWARARARSVGWRSTRGDLLGRRLCQLRGLGGLGVRGLRGVRRVWWLDGKQLGDYGVKGDGGGGDSRGRAGLGHRLVAAWARVRAAFGDE